MSVDVDKHHLITFLSAQFSLDSGLAERLVDEVCSFYQQSPEQFIRARHQQLQRAGRSNAEIYGQIATDLEQRLFAAPVLSDRQIRRIIYG